MAYLASVLGTVANYQPTTDTPENLANLVSVPRRLYPASSKRQLWRARILENLLPGPIVVKDVANLISFKEKHGSQLARFRNFIERFLLDLETASEEQVEERVGRFLSEAKAKIEMIVARMKENRWQRFNFGTLCTLAASALPMITTISQGDCWGTIGASMGIAATVAAALDPQQLRELERRPLAYAVLVKPLVSANLAAGKIAPPCIWGASFVIVPCTGA